MAGTHGRDRMCALIQYSFKFYYQCSSSSEDETVQNHWSVNASNRVAKNISLSRKMLKFLNFIQALQKAYVFYLFKQHKTLHIKILVQGRNISSFFLYFSDNIVWLLNLGILAHSHSRKAYWIWLKDMCAFVKNLTTLTKSIITIVRRKRSIKEINEQIKQSFGDGSLVLDSDHTHELIKKLLSRRAKQRYEKLGIVRYILRLLMLSTRLGFQPFEFLKNGVLFALFGYLENAIGLIRLFGRKKRMIRLSYYSRARQKYELKKQEEQAKQKANQLQ